MFRAVENISAKCLICFLKLLIFFNILCLLFFWGGGIKPEEAGGGFRGVFKADLGEGRDSEPKRHLEAPVDLLPNVSAKCYERIQKCAKRTK